MTALTGSDAMTEPGGGPELEGARREDTRNRAQHVAVELFAAQGFDKTSLREIAQRLGITKAALYYHFASKDDLLETIVAPLLDDLDQLVAEGAIPAVRPKRRSLLEAYLDLLLAHRPVVAWLANDCAIWAHPAVGTRAREVRTRIQQLLAGADMTVAERVRVTAALGALNSAVASLADVPLDQLREPLLAAARGILGIRGAGRFRPGGEA